MQTHRPPFFLVEPATFWSTSAAARGWKPRRTNRSDEDPDDEADPLRGRTPWVCPPDVPQPPPARGHRP